MIEFKKVSFRFDDRIIIDSFNDSFREGEHIALMGESGAGKSTLMNSLMGLTLPFEGEIVVDNLVLSVQNIQQIRSKIAWVPQEVHLPYDFVREALEEPFKLKVNQHKHFDKGLMQEYFSQLGLDHALFDARMQDISGGERQRIMLISALLLRKKILLLDEPTSAIDPRTRERLISFFSDLKLTLFAVTHDADFARTCHRTIHLDKIRQ